MVFPPRRLARRFGQLGAAAQNAMEVARFGGLDTGEESTRHSVLHEGDIYRLRRYLPDASDLGERPPILLVPPMMLAADVYDVSPSSSAAVQLAQEEIDTWVVDFGAPEDEEGGLERTLTDHVLAVSDAVDRVRSLTGRDVHLSGYSQGGMFCYQAAAFRRGEGITSLITYGSPVDTRALMVGGIPDDVLTRAVSMLTESPLANLSLPAWASRLGFRLLDPVKAVRQQIDFVGQLHDRDALLPRESQRRFLMADGWVAWPGPALADFLKQFVGHNRMLSGGFVIEDRLVTLADLDLPMLCVVGEVDEIAPPRSVRAIQRAAPRGEAWETRLRAGHFGLVVGSLATEITWPTVGQWIRWQEGADEPPTTIQPVVADTETAADPATRVSYGWELASQVGLGILRSAVSTAGRSLEGTRRLATEAREQLPRLLRLQLVEPNTRVSLGKILAEQASARPDSVFFLFEGRGYTFADASRRIDNIVRGLISVGVRQGEHVGVLMGPRPTSLALVAALSRLGAVAVMMRPDGEIEREAELGHVSRVITDPDHSALASTLQSLPVLVLGGGGEPRELGFGLTDMERIDPDQVRVPGWYRPDPGRAQDLAFILFTGRGARTRVSRITNRRWALSAFGTASAANLHDGDTVYAVTPLHHPSGLLTSIGGALAGGCRLALATAYEPATFWEEVRRYGVTVVSYTWTLLQPLVEASPDPAELHHPVRLFMGSGMPAGLWRRVVERFAPARVLEFYASTEAGVVLANVSGEKIGCKGRPLPGSARVAVAAWDATASRLSVGSDGFAVECQHDEVGMLLAKVDPSRVDTAGQPLRGLFESNDAWLATDDLFRRDADGDFWLVDHAFAVARTVDGPVPSVPIEDALGRLGAVDLVAAYGVTGPHGHAISVAAVTLRSGCELTGAAVASALERLPVASRPAVVHVLDELPLSTWYRPTKPALRAAGLPDPGRGPAWVRDAESGGYVAWSEERRDELALAGKVRVR